MSQQVIVNRELTFEGSSATKPNILGIPMSRKKIVDYCFDGTSTLYGWSSTTGSNGLTLTHTLVDGGAMLMTMGATNDDCGELYHNAQWSAAYNVGAQFKIKISRITDISVCCGFVDQYENTNDHTAIEMAAAALRSCSNTEDFAGAVFDTDATTDVWYGGASNNTTEGTPVAFVGSLAPTADTYFYVRVQTDTAGNVTFYYGGQPDQIVPVGYLPAAIAYASTNLLAPYVGLISRTTSAATATVSRVTIWQDN